MKRALVTTVFPILLVWVVLSWLIPGWLRISSSDVLMLRLMLIAIGIAGALAFLWLRRSDEEQAGAVASAVHDLNSLFAEAKERLRNSNLSKTQLGEMPAIVLVGDAGSAKTTTILRSGLDPELLAGQAFVGDQVAPTSHVNIWLARRTLVLDAGAAVSNDQASWRRLGQYLAPTAGTAIGKRAVAPRAAVVCLSCERFLEAGAAESLIQKARMIREQLSGLASALGISLPVYVLVTKADRLPFFVDYVANLSDDEAAQVLGTTLTFAAQQPGAYAEQQSQRLSQAFSTIYAALCDRRLLYLEREHDPARSAGVYEFPREFGKIRPLLVRFLVDLCRPSQLQSNPVLRGFYFTGVRPVTVADIEQAPVVPAFRPQPIDPAATYVFQQPQRARQEPLLPKASGRRIPQWVYLPRIFSDVILGDRAAFEASGSSVKTTTTRRIALLVLSAAGLFLTAAWTISFVANYRLVSRAENASRAAADLPPGTDGVPSMESLARLSELQSVAATLSGYEANGAPMHMRWGLYSGGTLSEPVHRSWCAAFQRLLLEPTQREMVRLLSRSATSGGDDKQIYNALKAYLTTTSFPAKSERPFLPDVLTTRWHGGKTIPPEEEAVASRQFDFYAAELARGRLCRQVAPDDAAVSAARDFLKNRSAAIPIYQEILAKANRQAPLVFNRLYPGSAAVVRNEYPVPAAFTKPGWSVVQGEINRPGTADEDWVLGKGATKKVDAGALKKELSALYRADLIKTWREYLRRTSVVGFGGIRDASEKLRTLSSNQSPLLKLLCLASENTAVDDKSIRDLFQPPQALVPAGCTNHWSSPANESYMSGLIGLQASLSTLSTDEPNEMLRNDALSKATAAGQTVSSIARNFTPDVDSGVDAATTNIIEAPIKYVQTLIAGVPKKQANGAAQAFCTEFNGLMKKYPFNPSKLAPPASFPEFEQVFKPGSGDLFKLVQNNLAKSILQMGTTFSAKPDADPVPGRGFLNFLNQAAAVSVAFYQGGQQAQLPFQLRVVPDEDVQSVNLSIDGQSMNYSRGGNSSQHFVWRPGDPQETRMRVKFTGGSDFDYPSFADAWALFKFMADSEQWVDKGNEYIFEKPLKTVGGIITVTGTGHPATVRLGLDMGGAPPVLKPGYFNRLSCVSVVAQ